MKDFSTPAAAILALEDAYRAKDLDAAVACKDFMAEAELMLRRMPVRCELNEELVVETARTLEVVYRTQLQGKGFPNFDGVDSRFPYTETLADNLVVVTELCSFPDGHITEQKLFVFRGTAGWRVLNPVSNYERPGAA